MNIIKDVSCYSSAVLIQYSRTLGIPAQKLFKGIEPYQSVLQNPLEWIESSVWNKLTLNIEACFPDNPNIMFDAGLEITQKQITNFQMLFLKIAPLKMIAANIPKHMKNNICKNIDMYAQSITSGGLELKTTPINKDNYSSQICDFNKGCSLATVISKGYKNARLEEVQCAARSQVHSCIYKITWDPENGISEKIKNFFFFWFRDQRAIIQHMEDSHRRLERQYEEILGMRDFYSHIMTSMTEAILWIDEHGSISYANRAFLDLAGIPEDTIINKMLLDFIAPLYAQSLNDALKKCSTEPMSPTTVEIVYESKHSGDRIGQTSIIWVPGDFRPAGYLVSIKDITETKKIQRLLFLAEDRYRSLYENSPAIIIGFDLNGRFIYANPAMVEQSGYSEEELKTMTVADLVAPNAELSEERIIARVLSESTRLQEVHFKNKANEWKSIALNTYHIFDTNHTLAGVAGIAVDITETKRLNEQLIKTQRMELLGQLAGGLAHDFNNILFSINGYSQIIIKTSTEEQIKKYAETIETAGARASSLIKNLLSFSRGGDTEKSEKFDVCDVVKEVKAMMFGVVPKVISVEIDIPETPRYVLGDSGKIHQCVMNLCMNAKDALGIHRGFIKISVVDVPEKTGYVHIVVADSGSGIPPDIIEKIFDPFFTTKKKKEGTGLGLSVVYGIVNAHKGTIHVDSHPGEGTIFRIELPLFIEGSKNTVLDKKNAVFLTSDSVLNTYISEIVHHAGYILNACTQVQDVIEYVGKTTDTSVSVIVDTSVHGLVANDFIKAVNKVHSNVTYILIVEKDMPEIQSLNPNAIIIKKPFQPAALLKVLKTT